MSLASPSMSGGRSHTPVKCISFPLLPCPIPDLAPRSPRLGEGCWAWGSGDVPRGIPPARLSFRKTSSRRSICLGFFLANSSTSDGYKTQKLWDSYWDDNLCLTEFHAKTQNSCFKRGAWHFSSISKLIRLTFFVLRWQLSLLERLETGKQLACFCEMVRQSPPPKLLNQFNTYTKTSVKMIAAVLLDALSTV